MAVLESSATGVATAPTDGDSIAGRSAQRLTIPLDPPSRATACEGVTSHAETSADLSCGTLGTRDQPLGYSGDPSDHRRDRVPCRHQSPPARVAGRAEGDTHLTRSRQPARICGPYRAAHVCGDGTFAAVHIYLRHLGCEV